MRCVENFVDVKRPDLAQLAMAAVELFKTDTVFTVSGPTQHPKSASNSGKSEFILTIHRKFGECVSSV